MKLSANAFQKLPFFLEPFFKAMAHKKHLCVYTVFLVAAQSRMLELLAFDEYCRFDTSAFFMRIKRASLYTHKESRSMKLFGGPVDEPGIYYLFENKASAVKNTVQIRYYKVPKTYSFYYIL